MNHTEQPDQAQQSEEQEQEVIVADVQFKQKHFVNSVSGSVVLQVKRESVNVKAVNLYLRGFENVEDSTEEEGSRIELLSICIPLVTYPTTLNQQSHSFDFSQKLPEKLPSTFAQELQHFGKSVRMSILYHATVQIEFNESADIYHHQEFIVTEKCPSKSARPLFASKIKNIDGNQEIAMKFRTDRGVFFPPQQDEKDLTHFNKIMLLCELTNESFNKDVEILSVKLMQYVTAKSKNELYRITDEVLRKNAHGVYARMKDSRMLVLKLPHDTQPSVNGTLIQSSYKIEVNCADATVLIPLEILHEQPVNIQSRTNSYRSSRSLSGYTDLEADQDTLVDPWEDEAYYVSEKLIERPNNPLCPCCTVM
ncbi:hypothetical protein AKO1_012099 [Acrasis kona]|uniref:Arrestin-like N-terminal domain-containing protein n=1 Tax=Acrasis kona TaxID=1008807 RepID=A0AAW2ZBR3_9EUKA